jgi:hypothetical protein
MTNYAQITHRTAALAEGFGLTLATRKLDCTEEDLAELVGRYSRGPKKGALKGFLHWDKVEKGGWDCGAGVVRPGDRLRYQVQKGYYFETNGALPVQTVTSRRLRQEAQAAFATMPAQDLLDWLHTRITDTETSPQLAAAIDESRVRVERGEITKEQRRAAFTRPAVEA